LLKLQNIILEMIATNEPLEDIVRRLCQEVERLASGATCSVLIVDSAGLLRPLPAPSLPDDYCRALDGIAIGPNVGSCGTAAYLRESVVTEDVRTDPRWDDYRHLLLPLGLVACWSSPILDARGEAIGTFGFYYREPRGPTLQERAIVDDCVHLCTIAIERQQRIAERELRAATDALTGLPNRAAFNAALASLECGTPGSWALFAIDLDNLKVVNDTFGHHAGDLLLIQAARRIAAAGLPDRAFRLGGDEFALVVRAPEALRDLEAAAQGILDRLAAPVDCGGHVVVPRATIGGAILSPGDCAVERVRQNADFALYHAKETGRGGFVRYWPGLGTRITRRLDAIRDVDAALRDGRIEPYYQPIVRLDTREIVGVEALCRMRMGDQVVSAMAFHEATTDAHVATALTERMIGLIAADVAAWLEMGVPFQHVGINVSSADIHGGTIDAVLSDAFARHNVPLKHVILEVTESVYMDNDGGIVARALADLRAKGLRIALDDFGTGYASLTHLMSVPVDVIKIDRSFVERLARDDPSLAIVEGIIGIARKMNIRVVSEGIETETQVRQLCEAGCALGQGWLFAKAVDRHAATELLMTRSQGLPRANPARRVAH
jgi:diguanylate cyclase (GGDEF)-like protein